MYSSLSTRRRILLALLILGGKSTYLTIKSFLPPARHASQPRLLSPGSEATGGQVAGVAGRVGYSGPKFYGMLKRLEQDGVIKRLHHPSSLPRRQAGIIHHPSIRLLPAGLKLLERRLGPRIRTVLAPQGQSLSENWSLIILNFPTAEAYSRSRLAGRLLELGCGSLRDGVYISPYPILSTVAEWAEENNCLNRVFLLTFSIQYSVFSIFLSAWNLAGLSRRYLSLLDRLTIAKGISLPPKRNRAITRIKSDFLDLLIQDPLLPKSLLPPGYPLARVIEEITGLYKDKSLNKTNIDNLSDEKLAKTGPENPSLPSRNS